MNAAPKRPRFVKLLTEDIGRYGWAGAGVLAHIRYRCASPAADRIQRSGHTYWLASLALIAEEINSTPRTIRSALQSAAPALDVLRKPNAPDQRSGYRVIDRNRPDLPFVESDTVVGSAGVDDASQAPDLPFVESDTVPEVIHNRVRNDKGVCQKRQGGVSETTNAPLLENLRKKREKGRERSADSDRPGAVPDPGNAPPESLNDDPAPRPQAASEPSTPAVVRIPATMRSPDPIPSRSCSRHPGGTERPCRDCATHREAHEAASANHAQHAQLTRARDALIRVSCDQCDEHGWRLSDDGAPADPAQRCDHPAYAQQTAS